MRVLAYLAWVTLQELNSKNFTVQRSFDGQVFENIGTVAAMGATPLPGVLMRWWMPALPVGERAWCIIACLQLISMANQPLARL